MEVARSSIDDIINSIDSLDQEELFRNYKITKDIRIRNELIKRFMYIPEILSKKYANKGIEYDDIFQVASLGLIYAIERYDIDKGYEFSSFATPTIIGEIKKYFRDKGWAVKVPRRIQELSKKVNEVKEKLQQDLQRAPTIKDIADNLNLTEDEVIEVMEASYVYTPKSIDMAYEQSGDDKNIPFSDIIGNDDRNFNQIEDKDFIIKIFNNLNDVEKKIIRDRFFYNKTQLEIAKNLGVSQMTVSRMEKKILNKFRKEYKKIEEL